MNFIPSYHDEAIAKLGLHAIAVDITKNRIHICPMTIVQIKLILEGPAVKLVRSAKSDATALINGASYANKT